MPASTTALPVPDERTATLTTPALGTSTSKVVIPSLHVRELEWPHPS